MYGGSETEVRHREGLPFGGLPHDALLYKLEETDPELVEGVRGGDEFYDIRDGYENYARGEIVDWTPDAPYLESDHARRDPGLGKSILNLRYNGTRGSRPELPRHSELFIGFGGGEANEPRGTLLDPRFDQVRGHMTARAANLTARMGNNDDHALAERPWTGQAISYAMKEVHRRVRGNTKVFSVSKEGRPWGRNYIADEFAAGDVRGAVLEAGGESLGARREGFAGPAAERFAAGDHGPADEMWSDGVRGAGVDAVAEAAPWRNVVGEADLGVQKYGQARGAGRGEVGAAAQGGGRLGTAAADQAWAATRLARGTNRQTLGATMALAARHRRAVKSGAHDSAHAAGADLAAGGTPGAGLRPGRDLSALHRHSVEDAVRRQPGQVQDGDGGRLGGAAGLAPAADGGRAARSTLAEATANGHLTNVGAMVSGLREGTAAGRRRIAANIVADGARPRLEAEAAAKRGVAPGGDYGKVARLVEAPLARSAAAGLAVHTYSGLTRGDPERRVGLARGAYDDGTWREQKEGPALGKSRRADEWRSAGQAQTKPGAAWHEQREALPAGQSRRAGEWRSAGQAQTTIGDSPDNLFGLDAETPGGQGAAPMGPKSLRAGGASDSAGLTDEVGGGLGAE